MMTVSERQDIVTNPPLAASMIHNRSSVGDPDSDGLCVTSAEVEDSKISGGDCVSVSMLSIDIHGLAGVMNSYSTHVCECILISILLLLAIKCTCDIYTVTMIDFSRINIKVFEKKQSVITLSFKGQSSGVGHGG